MTLKRCLSRSPPRKRDPGRQIQDSSVWPWVPAYEEAMPLRCRPRAGGDPYAAARRCGRASDDAKPWWLWVPACAGTTAARFVPRTLEYAGSRLRGNERDGSHHPSAAAPALAICSSSCEATPETPIAPTHSLPTITGTAP